MRARRVLLAVLLVLVTTPAGAQTQAGWGLPQLMVTLARVKSASAQFVERKTLRVLDTPLVSSGTLLYVAPDQVEKITVLPERERLAISGDKLTIEAGASDRPRTLSLTNAPEIAAFVESIRATLAGDLPALDRFYRVELAGGPASWKLDLIPRAEKLAQLVRRIRISGSGEKITAVETDEADGDRSEMSVAEDVHER
jgi:Outer membrane lipoprotein carrier protein LolA-like